MNDWIRKLADSDGEVMRALDQVRVPAALLDSDGVVRWQNAASREVTGEFFGSRLVDIVVPEDRREAYEFLTSVLHDGEPADITLRSHGGRGSSTLSATPLRDGGAVVGMFGLGRRLSASREVPSEGNRPTVQLTERQLSVLRLLAEGQSTAEIASEFALSTTTVRNHVAGLLAALGVSTRLQAVVVAHRTGLVEL